MPSVIVKASDSIEVALRKFKRACEKSGVLSELRRRECHEKASEKRKRKAAAARKRHLKKLAREALMPLRERDRGRGRGGKSKKG